MGSRLKFLRKCHAEYFDKVLGPIEFDGYFHQFATTFEELNDGVAQVTIALVEDEYGQVHECDPKIRFLST